MHIFIEQIDHSQKVRYLNLLSLIWWLDLYVQVQNN